MSLSIAVMSHPSREPLYVPEAAVVVKDRGEGVWDTARRAWCVGLDYPDADWHLVLQDDIAPVEDFLPAFIEALACVPERTVVSAFGVSKWIRMAYDRGFSFLADTGLAWGQAVAIPREMIYDFIYWCDVSVRPDYKHDDARISLYCLNHGNEVWYTVPCLVEHEGWDRSVAGNPSMLGGRPRRAAVKPYISALTLPWDGPVKYIRTKRLSDYNDWRM